MKIKQWNVLNTTLILGHNIINEYGIEYFKVIRCWLDKYSIERNVTTENDTENFADD